MSFCPGKGYTNFFSRVCFAAPSPEGALLFEKGGTEKSSLHFKKGIGRRSLSRREKKGENFYSPPRFGIFALPNDEKAVICCLWCDEFSCMTGEGMGKTFPLFSRRYPHTSVAPPYLENAGQQALFLGASGGKVNFVFHKYREFSTEKGGLSTGWRGLGREGRCRWCYNLK